MYHMWTKNRIRNRNILQICGCSLVQCSALFAVYCPPQKTAPQPQNKWHLSDWKQIWWTRTCFCGVLWRRKQHVVTHPLPSPLSNHRLETWRNSGCYEDCPYCYYSIQVTIFLPFLLQHKSKHRLIIIVQYFYFRWASLPTYYLMTTGTCESDQTGPRGFLGPVFPFLNLRFCYVSVYGSFCCWCKSESIVFVVEYLLFCAEIKYSTG